MGLGHSPRIITENLVLLLDAANPRNFDLTKVEVLVVAGGGGGASRHPGGGGGGGVIYNPNFAVTPGTQLTATVGDGGAGKILTSNLSGDNGSNSVFGSLIALGGGGGGSYLINGASGGSSGGGGEGGITTSESATQPSSGSGGFGNAGGGQSVSSPSYGGGGGGGGSGGPGTSGNGTTAGSGGPGLQFSINGTPTYYAGGGGGAAYNLADGTGGLGGGGNGATESSTPPNGTVNTGGGGGGNATGASYAFTSGAGGSGIIIVRYQGPQKAIGGTVTSVNGDTIHTFTTSGNFTPLVNTNGSAVLGLSDLSGNRNFGATAGSPIYNSANGGSLVFEGSDEYVDCGTFFTYQTFTIELWVNPGTSQNTYADIFDNNHTGNQNFVFQQNADALNQYGFGVSDASGSISGTGIIVLTANTWTHVAFTFSPSTRVIGYVNGVFHSQGNLANGRNIAYVNQSLALGRWQYGGGNRYWNGKISNFKTYNRILTAAEVSQNFNALRGRYGL